MDELHGVNLVLGLCAAAYGEELESVLSAEEWTQCQRILSEVRLKLMRIYAGEEKNDSSDPLPSVGFIRHCGTPLADRFREDTERRLAAALGAQRYKEVEAALDALRWDTPARRPNHDR